jgi:hypothetical protein
VNSKSKTAKRKIENRKKSENYSMKPTCKGGAMLFADTTKKLCPVLLSGQSDVEKTASGWNQEDQPNARP